MVLDEVTVYYFIHSMYSVFKFIFTIILWCYFVFVHASSLFSFIFCIIIKCLLFSSLVYIN